jgi:SNF2 family DNA or RNA helicase
VLCAGIQALRLGWNLDMARAAIVCGFPWSHEALDQAVARVHRLTSKEPVEVYVVLAKGTLDARKWELLCEKMLRPGQAGIPDTPKPTLHNIRFRAR